jgi:endonuclease/exonuclease/phosphatase family metal-dependent hydrolase
VRVATFNVWALPWRASLETEARLDAIGAQLEAFALDIMAFQEVWTEDARRRLVKAGRRCDLAHAWFNEGSFSRSGLLVLSRAPYDGSRFESYVLRGFPHRLLQPDYHGLKGFCMLRFGERDRGLVMVDTHLHARYVKDSLDDAHPYRVGQIVQLSAALAELRAPLVIAGDFNMREGRPEYAVFSGLTGARDAAIELSRREPTTLASNAYRKLRDASSEERIDYLFARDGNGRRVRLRSLERIFDAPPAHGPAAFSDHAGLLAEFELVEDPESRVPAPEESARELAASVLAGGRAASKARRGDQRLLALGSLGGAGLAAAGAARPPISRRRVLRAGLGLGALCALPVGLVNAALSELAFPNEVEAFDEVERRLAALRAGPR